MDIQVSENTFLMVDEILVTATVIVVLSLLAARATRDMNDRGATGWVFGLLVAFLPPLGLAVWAIAASMLPRRRPGATARSADPPQA